MKPRSWTEQEVKRLLELREQRFHTEEIALILSRTDQAVRLKLNALGYSSVNPPRSQKAPSSNLEPDEATEAQAPSSDATIPETQADAMIVEKGASQLPQELSPEIRGDFAAARDALAASEVRQSQQKYAQLLRLRSMEERWLEFFASRFELFVPNPAVPPSEIEPMAGGGESAVLLVSDTHIGQNVSSEQTGGFGDYNVRRYCERLAFLETQVLDLLRERKSATEELVVFLLGDMLHGTLSHHAEREETLLLSDQFQLALWTLHQFLRRLRNAVPKLRVHTAVGNHGRLPSQRRMPTVGRYSNFDQLLYSSLELSLRSLAPASIDFQLGYAPRETVVIQGARFQASHGDHLRGGDRQTGVPFAAISREVSVTAQRQAAARRPRIDYFLAGDKHKHASLPLPTGAYLLNGSFVGADEFAAFEFPPSEPVQLLFWVHPTMGKTWQHDIKLQWAPRLEQLPYDFPRHINYLLDRYGDEGGGLQLCA